MSVKLLRDGCDPVEVQINQLTPTVVATLFQVGGDLVSGPSPLFARKGRRAKRELVIYFGKAW